MFFNCLYHKLDIIRVSLDNSAAVLKIGCWPTCITKWWNESEKQCIVLPLYILLSRLFLIVTAKVKWALCHFIKKRPIPMKNISIQTNIDQRLSTMMLNMTTKTWWKSMTRGINLQDFRKMNLCQYGLTTSTICFGVWYPNLAVRRGHNISLSK